MIRGSDFDEHALNRLKRDLGDAVDDARITVRAGDLRGLLAWQEDNADAYEDGRKAGRDELWAEFEAADHAGEAA